MQIEDGTGTGRKASVNHENRLRSESVSSTTEHHINHHEKQSYNALFSQTPAGADDCIFYMQNASTTDLCVEGIWLYIAGATEIYVQINDIGTPASGTTVTPANLNAGSGNMATGTFEQGTDLAAGAALSGGTEIERYVFSAATDTKRFNFEQDVILSKNTTLTIWSSLAVAIKGTVVFNYHSRDITG